jgi:hypothetical protein
VSRTVTKPATLGGSIPKSANAIGAEADHDQHGEDEDEPSEAPHHRREASPRPLSPG